VKWLGEVPKGWELKRLNYLMSNVVAKNTESTNDEQIIALENIEGWTGRLIEPENQKRPEGDLKVFAAGDLLFGKLRPYLAKATIASNNGLCVGEVLVLRVEDKLDNRFLLYRILTKDLIEYIDASTQGAKMPRAEWEFIKTLPIAFPDASQQRVIANFLDRKTALIDDVIAKKQKLIELLKEKRQALITQAVTKGLDPNAKLNKSGIEWLGDVPEAWEVKRLRFLSKGPFEYGANEEASDDNPEDPRYIRITDIREDGELHSDTFRSLPIDVAKPYLLQEGDLLFARSGATVGKTFRYKDSWGQCCYAGYLIRMRSDTRKVDSKFLHYYTLSDAYMQWKDSVFWQATIQNISAEKYKNFIIALPTLKEQSLIVAFLAGQTTKTDDVIGKVTVQIDKLKEYRQALITSAVTGKIDVRGE
jgi:restriction endonuclease S subunit